MRRILRKVAAGETEMSAFGDTSTLADPSVVDKIVETAPER
jgi:acetyl-CoA synthetase